MNSNKPLLIGLWSPTMGSGKSEVASALIGSGVFKQMAMAHSLKAMFASFLVSCGLTEYEAWACATDAHIKEQPLEVLGGKTPRHAMQTLGTEWGRDCMDPDLWLRSGLRRAEIYRRQGMGVVFDDVRFPNEAAAVEEADGYMVRVVRPGATITQAHPSEGALADWDFKATIINDSSLEVLQQRARTAAAYLRKLDCERKDTN